MRILLVNYRYFISGGPERYMFNVIRALEARGHEVVPFSIRYAKNEPTEYDRYFVDPLAGPDAIRFNEHRWTPRTFCKTLERSFYSVEVEKAVSRIVRDTKPDVAYVLHFLRKLSPAVLVGIKRHGVPLVVRLCDFLWLCPAIHCLRDGKPCTLCARGNDWPSVRYGCVSGSRPASLVALLARKHHRQRRYFDLIDRVVVTNPFTMQMMVDHGWSPARFSVIPTMAAPGALEARAADTKKGPYILFSGHLERHKGPDILIKAYAAAVKRHGAGSPRLKIAGSPEGEFGAHCVSLARSLGVNDLVDLLGFLDTGPLWELYSNALFTVIPSIWYENLPNVLIESYASGTAVIGSGHGSIAPYIDEGKTGYAFNPWDPHSLADRLITAWSDPDLCTEMGKNAREKARELFSEKEHMNKLLSVFGELVPRFPPLGEDPTDLESHGAALRK
ncbi:MAG: glycosyltransferase family 4 protein [Lentisphaerae bacterium]|nr:glycosyltransferase family 4 protein [Lentisphaerota bacterium]